MSTNHELLVQATEAIPPWRAFLDAKEAELRQMLAEVEGAARAAATPAGEAPRSAASMAALLDEVLEDEEGEAEAKEVPVPPAKAEASTPLVAGEGEEDEAETSEEGSEGDETALPPGEIEAGEGEAEILVPPAGASAAEPAQADDGDSTFAPPPPRGNLKG